LPLAAAMALGLSAVATPQVLAGTARGAADAPATTAATGPGHSANGRIVFSSSFMLVGEDPTQPSQVFSVRPDGSHLRQLTNVPAGSAAGSPDVSPDGRRVAYLSTVSGRVAVWMMRLDGSHQHRLFGARNFDYFQPRWSPDGTRLAVSRCDVRFGFTAACDIDVIDADGTGRHQVVGGHRLNRDPVWSPDGSRIAFDSDRAGLLSAVWVAKASGRGRPTRLTGPNLEAFWPSWSPDGSRLIVCDNFDRPNGDVFVMRPDGSHLRQLTHFRADHGGCFASYSPNGRRIVLSSDARRRVGADKADLFTMHADGTHLTRIVTDPPAGVLADWAPRRSLR
jgi:TolB protein